jgi:glycosyltransferase involved in cell wall biosynthesis
MRILLAMVSAGAQISGVQRHAINAARCLLSRGEVEAVHLVVAPWHRELVVRGMPGNDPRLQIEVAAIGAGNFERNAWYYFQLPRLAAELRIDVVHFAYPMPVRSAEYPCPTVATLHDLYPCDIPENFGFPRVLFNRAVLWQCLRAVDAVACVSQSTLSRLEGLEPGLALQKASVVSNCVEAHPGTSTLSPPPDLHGYPFLLCVAQHRRNKNLLFLLEVFRTLIREHRLAPGTRLVIVGMFGPETRGILRFLQQQGMVHRVLLLRGLSEDQLQWCYRNCCSLVAPSITEGFGLPVAEALLAGCRVVCSDIAAFREVGGDRCRYVALGPLAQAEFVETISASLWLGPSTPVKLPQFSLPVIAEKYMRLYRSVLGMTGTNDQWDPAADEREMERKHLV